MARAIKIVDKVTPNLGLVTGNIQNAMATGVTASVAASTATTRFRIAQASTKTGRMRVAGIKPRFKVRPAWYAGRGPGRIESARLLNSARWTVDEKPGKITAVGGFIRPPSYLELQEKGDGKIPPMLAFAKGLARFEAVFPKLMNANLNSAIRAAHNGKTFKRSGV